MIIRKDRIIKISLILLYLLGDIIQNVIRRLSGNSGYILFVVFINLIVGFSLFFVIKQNIYRQSIKKPLLILVVVFLFQFISLVVHPEYLSWYLHDSYGVIYRFLPITSAVFGIVYSYMFEEKEEFLICIGETAEILLWLYMFQFLHARQRGYWNGITYTGDTIRLGYSIEFGYNVAFCFMCFISLYLYDSRRRYVIEAIVSLLLLVGEGSRGALLCIGMGLLLLVISKWREEDSLRRVLLLVGIIIMAIIFITAFPFLVEMINVNKVSSRTIQSLVSGEFLNDNGRSIIWTIALGMVRSSGYTGYGFYGDRYVIGRRFYWGYPHNVFLEVLIEFGIMIGVILIVYFLYSFIKMYLKCKDIEWQLLVAIFGSACSKLLISDSFWYNRFFWLFLGVLLMWKDEEKVGFD